MISFILNNEDITTDLPPGMTVLDLVRYRKGLKGTKIGCREGDCGACTILVGELLEGEVRYRSMTSCLMPLSNAAGKHIVTVEGINPEGGGLTMVQQAMVNESGTQCGFCTVGFVMSLTGFCLGTPATSPALIDQAISSIDGNICRCTGYKSIERAASQICDRLKAGEQSAVPDYFAEIPARLRAINGSASIEETRSSGIAAFVGGGTDVYVQRPEEMAEQKAAPLLFDEQLRGIRDLDGAIEVGASVTVTDLLESPIMQSIFPNLYRHLKLVSSTPIRNMATLAGNFVNASPIGDMTVWFLALDAEIDLLPGTQAPSPATSPRGVRTLSLRDLYLGYKQLAKKPDEMITAIRFKKPVGDHRFNFEKVCKRTYLDIATVNTAISLRVGSPYVSSPHVSSPHVSKGSYGPSGALTNVRASDIIIEAHVSAGGVAPIPFYLKETSAFLKGKTVSEETIAAANEIMQSEISPISDVRGTQKYKRLLLRQLFKAHFVELFEL
jgi:xanthine dehydrogenase small subunit